MPHVLVMDDQPHVRATIKATLQLNGFDVTEAGDGKAGLAAFDTTKFDLAIIDIYMPKLDGVKVIKQLRARNPALPIIAISGVALGKSARTTLDFLPDAGLNDVFCLKKPFRSAELLSVVENVLQFAQWPTQPVSA